MEDQELTTNEKVKLLANLDARGITGRNEQLEYIIYNTEFSNLLELEAAVRATVFKFISEMADKAELAIDSNPENCWPSIAAWLTIAWYHGYQVALQWGKPIERSSPVK